MTPSGGPELPGTTGNSLAKCLGWCLGAHPPSCRRTQHLRHRHHQHPFHGELEENTQTRTPFCFSPEHTVCPRTIPVGPCESPTDMLLEAWVCLDPLSSLFSILVTLNCWVNEVKRLGAEKIHFCGIFWAGALILQDAAPDTCLPSVPPTLNCCVGSLPPAHSSQRSPCHLRNP